MKLVASREKSGIDDGLVASTLVNIYAVTHNPDLLEPIVEHYMPFIRRVVEGVISSTRISSTAVADRQDYHSIGIIAFLNALKRYNPKIGPLEKFVSSRVYGAVIDEYRAISLPGNFRRIETEWQKYKDDQSVKGEPAHHADFTERFKLPTYKLAMILGMNSLMSIDDAFDKPASLPDPVGEIGTNEERKALYDAIQQLPNRDQKVILARLEGLTNKAIADQGIVGFVDESRVSQLLARAQKRLTSIIYGIPENGRTH